MKNSYLVSFLMIVIVLGFFYFLVQNFEISKNPNTLGVQSKTSPAISTSSGVLKIGQRTQTSGCVAQNGLQDKACSPGSIIPGVTKDQVCTPGYAKSVRNVPESEKEAVYKEYGITSHITGQYEVDHLISLELGGSNDIANLWPEAAIPTPGFHEKDKVENYLHDQVCSGAISLEQAQVEIANDWLAIR